MCVYLNVNERMNALVLCIPPCAACEWVWLQWDWERMQTVREREMKKEWKKERKNSRGRRGKLKLHDEYIGAQSPDWERQSEHRYTVSEQTVRGWGNFPMEAGLGCTHEHTKHTQRTTTTKHKQMITHMHMDMFSAQRHIEEMSAHTRDTLFLLPHTLKCKVDFHHQRWALTWMHSAHVEHCPAPAPYTLSVEKLLMHVVFLHWGNRGKKQESAVSGEAGILNMHMMQTAHSKTGAMWGEGVLHISRLHVFYLLSDWHFQYISGDDCVCVMKNKQIN